MAKYERNPKWEKLNNLAREYSEITQPLLEQDRGKIFYESGKDPDTGEFSKFEIDYRSEKQKELAGEIVEGVVPYLYKIARKLLYGHCVITIDGEKKVVSLKGLAKILEEDELVSIGALSLMKGLHNFNSDNGSISTFINYTVAFGMHRYAISNYPGVIDIPSYLTLEIRPLIVQTSRKNVIEAMKQKFKMSGDMAAIIYESITGEHRNIHESSGNLKLEEILPDESPSTNMAYKTEMLLIGNKISEVLNLLTEKEKKIIRLRFGFDDSFPKTLKEIGLVFNISRDRVRQIEAEALKILRHYITNVLEQYVPSQTVQPWELAEGMKAREKY